MMFLDRLRCINDTTPRSAALNMALDEVLLWHTSETALPVLRRYQWRVRSVSLGYFSRYRDVVGRYPGWELVRRWTGGGVVEHDADFTYSLILPCSASNSLPNNVTYRVVHAALASGLRDLGVIVDQVTVPDLIVSDACFNRAVVADLKSGERKVAGAAMRRHRLGVLLQGSVQGLVIPPTLCEAFANRLARELCWDTVSPELERAGEEITAAKYGLQAWTERF